MCTMLCIMNTTYVLYIELSSFCLNNLDFLVFFGLIFLFLLVFCINIHVFKCTIFVQIFLNDVC